MLGGRVVEQKQRLVVFSAFESRQARGGGIRGRASKQGGGVGGAWEAQIAGRRTSKRGTQERERAAQKIATTVTTTERAMVRATSHCRQVEAESMSTLTHSPRPFLCDDHKPELAKGQARTSRAESLQEQRLCQGRAASGLQWTVGYRGCVSEH